jgi:hypothetical protein
MADELNGEEIAKELEEHFKKLKEIFPPHGIALMVESDPPLSQDQILGMFREYEEGSDPFKSLRHTYEEEIAGPLVIRSAKGHRDDVDQRMAFLLGSNAYLLPKSMRKGIENNG